MYRVALSKIEDWNKRKPGKPLVLMGARQVGKTWLMNTFAEKCYSGNAVSFNFMEDIPLRESFERARLDPVVLMGFLQARSGSRIEPGKTLVIFDEIQESPMAVTSLKFFKEKMPELSIIAAGSLLGLSLRRESIGKRVTSRKAETKGSFPVGMVEFLDIHPLSFGEFLMAMDEEMKLEAIKNGNWEILNLLHDDLSALLKIYLFVGGMPEAVERFTQTRDYQSVRKIHNEILRAYDKDFVKHADASLLGRIRLLWNNIPAQLAKENRKFIYKALKDGARGRDYEEALQWLDDAGMLYKVHRVETPRMPLKSYQDFNAFKLYVHDVGLLGAISELPVKVILEKNDIFTNFKGAMTEQYVLQEFIANGAKPSYWSSDKGDAEIDFLLQGEEGVFPVEAKAEKNLKAKSLKIYRNLFMPTMCYRSSLATYSSGRLTRDIPLYALSEIVRETGAATE